MSSRQNFTLSCGTVAVFSYGQPSNTPIVMIHGFRGTHNGLELIAEQLAADYYVIVPDLPGFGDSDAFAGEPHNLPNYTQFLRKCISALHLTAPPILLGHSFGSIVVSHFAASHQDMISKLILINPIGAPALEGSKAILSKLALLYYKIGAQLPAKPARTWLSAKLIVWLMSKTMTKTKDKALIRYIDEQHFTHFSRFRSKHSVLEAFEVSITHTVREFAPEISLPTLLVIGNIDDITPLDKQFELAKQFPRAEIQIIQNVGHLIHYEAPEQAASYIRKFID